MCRSCGDVPDDLRLAVGKSFSWGRFVKQRRNERRRGGLQVPSVTPPSLFYSDINTVGRGSDSKSSGLLDERRLTHSVEGEGGKPFPPESYPPSPPLMKLLHFSTDCRLAEIPLEDEEGKEVEKEKWTSSLNSSAGF